MLHSDDINAKSENGDSGRFSIKICKGKFFAFDFFSNEKEDNKEKCFDSLLTVKEKRVICSIHWKKTKQEMDKCIIIFNFLAYVDSYNQGEKVMSYSSIYYSTPSKLNDTPFIFDQNGYYFMQKFKFCMYWVLKECEWKIMGCDFLEEL